MARKRSDKPRQTRTRRSKARATPAGPELGIIYQFKITLRGAKPPIWRRIQVTDCTLDDLHEHIQLAMGWTNSHLHQFTISDQVYGDPDLLVELMEDEEAVNSRVTMLSEVLPETKKKFRFEYEYDFGDGWRHEILFEGVREAARGQRYPLCTEGERACPPEDVGGIWGYQDVLAALADPKHEQHNEFLEWNGPYNPEAFAAADATKAMHHGLPDWRAMR